MARNSNTRFNRGTRSSQLVSEQIEAEARAEDFLGNQEEGFAGEMTQEERMIRLEDVVLQQKSFNQQVLSKFDQIFSQLQFLVQELRNSKNLGQEIAGSGTKNDRRILSSESRSDHGILESASTGVRSDQRIFGSGLRGHSGILGSGSRDQIHENGHQTQRRFDFSGKIPSTPVTVRRYPRFHPQITKNLVEITPNPTKKPSSHKTHLQSSPVSPNSTQISSSKKTQQRCSTKCLSKPLRSIKKLQGSLRRSRRNRSPKVDVDLSPTSDARKKKTKKPPSSRLHRSPTFDARKKKTKKPQSSHLHRKPKLKKPPRPISSKKKKKPNKKSPFSNGYGFSSVLILNFPPNFVRQLSNKAYRNCSNIGIAQVAAASWANSPSSDALISISASEAAEKAGSVTLPREGPEFSLGLNWALAGRGVIVKDKVLHNLDSSELQKNGATRLESLFGIPLHMRGNSVEGASKISRAQFDKLLKQVTSHISSVSNVFVQVGAVASAAKCDAKVRVISDSPSAVLSLSHILWGTPSRAVSHDSCPLTVYVASISQVLGLATQASTGFAVADIERSSLILCGRAFADATRDALVALAAPLISAREGLLLAARLLEAGDSMILLFASEDIIRTCFDLCQALVIRDAGVVLGSDCFVPFSRTRGPAKKFLKKPASVIIASTDSTGVIPSVLKLYPGQAAYHFLASYQVGKFLIAFSREPSPLDPLILAKALLSHLKNNEISSFLINVNSGELIIDESEQILDMRLVVKGNHLTSQVPSNGSSAHTWIPPGDFTGIWLRGFIHLTLGQCQSSGEGIVRNRSSVGNQSFESRASKAENLEAEAEDLNAVD